MKTQRREGGKPHKSEKKVMRKVTREERGNCWRRKTKEEAEEEARRNGARNGTKQKEMVTHMEKHALPCCEKCRQTPFLTSKKPRGLAKEL